MEKALKQTKANIVRVVLFGPESTGKTTLSSHLARHYKSVWVREYAREYLQNKWNNERKTCENSDLMPIAFGQMKLENELSKKAHRILICDTDLLETKVYSEEYYGGFVNPNLETAAIANTYDLYLLTYIDTPWEKDDLRDRPELRLEMFNAFESALKKYNRPYILLKGDKKNYQMDFRNSDEAIREVALDIKEGADMVMVKPGMPYLDIIKTVKDNFKIPVLAYQVSGEYSLLSNSIKKGLIDKNSVLESLISFKRAGANAIVSYYADRINDLIK